jgi:hypothetical protein
MKPKIISGKNHKDNRGTLRFNNDFDASKIKRIYFIENENTSIIRAWQGHQIESRWFSVIKGTFKIQLIAIDNWENPSKNLNKITFIINENQFDVLQIPPGHVSSIQAIELNSKLLVMADYSLNEIKDEYRFPSDYFES